MTSHQYSAAAAMGLFKSVISLIFVGTSYLILYKRALPRILKGVRQMKIKRSGSYYIYQVFNTVVLALVALTCFIFPILHVLAMSLSSSNAAMAGRVTFLPVSFPFRL